MDNIESNNSNTRIVNVAIIMPGEAEIPMHLKVEKDATDEDILGMIWEQWNMGSGKECNQFLAICVGSLSTHDIVRIDDKFYQVKSIGWQLVSAGYVRALDAEVRAHEDYRTFHASAALSSVMWSRKEMAKEAMRIV